MAEQKNIFQRIATLINNTTRTDISDDPRLSGTVLKFEEIERENMVEDARREAITSLSFIKHYDTDELRIAYAAAQLDETNIPNEPRKIWNNDEALAVQVEYDMLDVARNSAENLETAEGKIAAYISLRDIYDDIHTEVQISRMSALKETRERDSVDIAHSERWQVSNDDPNLEMRHIVVQTDAGYHPGYEESYMGGESTVNFSPLAFDNLAKARTLTWDSEDGTGDMLARASQIYDAAIRTITDLSHNETLTIGQQAQLLDAFSEIEVGMNQINIEDTSKLSAWSNDPEERQRLAELVDSHKDQMSFSTSIQQELSRVGIDRHDAAAIDSYVQETYGSEEAIIRQFRVSEALERIGHAVRDGQAPMFQNQEHMEAFRHDLEKTYGSGSFDRLLTGNDRDLEQTIPQAEFRQQISQGLSGMVRDAEQHSSAEMEVNHAFAALDRRMARADWYSHFSDDSTVRISGAREFSALVKDVSEFAAQSPAAAERISQSWDERAPVEMIKFPGYLPESERSAAVAKGHDAGNAHSADQDRER